MVFRVILPLSFLILLSSCIPTSYIEDLAIVTALGADLTEEDQLEVTFVYFDFEEKKAVPKLITGNSTTIIGAAVDAQLKVKYKLIPDEMQLKIFGLDLAKQGISPYLDQLSRDPKQTDIVSMLLSETTAKEVLEAQENSDLKGNIGQHLYEIINKKSPTKQFPYVPLNQLLIDIENHSRDPILPMFSLDDEKMPELSSIALLKGDKFVDKLPIEDTLLFNLLGRGTFKDQRLEFSLPAEPFKKYLEEEYKDLKRINLALELIKGKDRKQISKDDPQKFNVTVDILLSIVEIIGPLPFKDPDVIDLIEKELEKQFSSRFEKLTNTLQELNVDPVGFGEKYRIHQKKQDLRTNEWRNIFPDCDISYDVNVSILDYGEHS